MAETMDKVIDVQINQEKFESNIAGIQKNIIAETNPEAYRIASLKFVKMATGELSPEIFKDEYRHLDIPVNMLKTVVDQTHLPGGIGASGKIISGPEATEFVRASVIEKLAEEIAEAKYPIIDHKESTYISSAFSAAKTPEQRTDAIRKYPQLDQAFQFSDAMKIITKKDPTDYVSQLLANGKVPEMTDDLRKAVNNIEQQEELVR